MSDYNAMYEVEDFSYCEGCLYAQTGVCDNCRDGNRHSDEYETDDFDFDK